MAKNEVTIKGIVDPDAVCAKITTKTKRVAKVLSPSPPLPEGEPSPHLIVNSQVSKSTLSATKMLFSNFFENELTQVGR